jgi:hypothetical protein
MLLVSAEPASIISQRAARHLARFQHWAVIDANGVTRSSQNFDDRAWVSIEPPENESDGFDFVGDDEADEPLTEVERVFGRKPPAWPQRSSYNEIKIFLAWERSIGKGLLPSICCL